MLQNIKTIKILFVATVIFFSLGLSVAAQSAWLDLKPLPSWNERKRAILETKKISPAELKRCAVVVRQPALPQDFLLTKMGWTLVGAAHVFAKTTIITTAEAFDGMCRPLKFENYVFVGNRVAGTLSPGQMDSRTDGYLTDIKMPTEKSITAEFARYRESDALCCPYKIEAVTYKIKPDGANFLLVPEGKFETSVSNKNEENQPSEANMSKDADALKNAVWRWENTETSSEKIAVDKPENYTLEFLADSKLQVRADCNRGRGTYQAENGKLIFSAIALTRAACPPESLDRNFLNGLDKAQNYKIEGDTLLIELSGGGTMRFSRISSNDESSLENTIWRWRESENSQGKVTVDKPENYEIRFNANGELGAKADCNGGGANYKAENGKLTISPIIRTQIFCGEDSLDKRFVQGLEQAQTYRVEDNSLFIEGADENGTMKFFRVSKQN